MPSATRWALPRMVVDRAYMSALLSESCGDAPRPSPRGPLSSPPAAPDSPRGALVTTPADAALRTPTRDGRRPSSSRQDPGPGRPRDASLQVSYGGRSQSPDHVLDILAPSAVRPVGRTPGAPVGTSGRVAPVAPVVGGRTAGACADARGARSSDRAPRGWAAGPPGAWSQAPGRTQGWSGGGGNRTRVLRRITRASPSAVRSVSR